MVIDVNDTGIFDVKFMKRTFDGTFVYPKNNDFDSITESSIQMVTRNDGMTYLLVCIIVQEGCFYVFSYLT